MSPISGSDVRNGACLEPRAIAKAPEGQGCPRCGGFVYAAEQMLARGRVSSIPFHHNILILFKSRDYLKNIKKLEMNENLLFLLAQGYHRRCFKCLNCNKTLDSTMHCDGPDKEIYCRG